MLPLFMLFFLNLSAAMDMIRLHGNLELALWNAGRDLALYGPMVQESGKGALESLGLLAEGEEGSEPGKLAADMGISYLYVKGRIVSFLGEDYLEASPLMGGTAGLQFFESKILGQGDRLDLVLSYPVRTPFPIAGNRYFLMANRYCAHLWNGYALDPGEGEEAEETYVYVCENSEVYHVTTSCGSLKLSTRTVPFSGVGNLRSRDGSVYYPCEYCGGGSPGVTVLITDYGNRYHLDPECRGLRRTYETVPLREAQKDHRACMRCGG
ncbi:MAG: hypothetical protein K5891_10730 [Lachnospiraceae bacterium]|nr:hypothetical protein [Lachnospiraceae bacterium]